MKPTMPAMTQVEFWEKAAIAALHGYASSMNAPVDMAERVARLADALTRQWLMRHQPIAEKLEPEL